MIRTITVNTKTGIRTTKTELTLNQAYGILWNIKNPTGFVTSLCEAYSKYNHRITASQGNWILTLAQEELDRKAGAKAEAPKVEVGGFSEIKALFDRAAEHLQHPKIRLEVAGKPVVMMVAGPRSKNAGSISVTTGEAVGTPGSFYGRIDRDGTTTVKDPAVLGLLAEFAKDPAGVAAAYGKLTGNCCFCKMGLTDERSTDVGYGPVCADNWGLPWGNKRRVEAVAPEIVDLTPYEVVGDEPAGEPLTFEALMLGCSEHITGYNQLPMVLVS